MCQKHNRSGSVCFSLSISELSSFSSHLTIAKLFFIFSLHQSAIKIAEFGVNQSLLSFGFGVTQSFLKNHHSIMFYCFLLVDDYVKDLPVKTDLSVSLFSVLCRQISKFSDVSEINNGLKRT